MSDFLCFLYMGAPIQPTHSLIRRIVPHHYSTGSAVMCQYQIIGFIQWLVRQTNRLFYLYYDYWGWSSGIGRLSYCDYGAVSGLNPKTFHNSIYEVPRHGEVSYQAAAGADPAGHVATRGHSQRQHTEPGECSLGWRSQAGGRGEVLEMALL